MVSEAATGGVLQKKVFLRQGYTVKFFFSVFHKIEFQGIS